jgi:outer membrane protein TolC
MTPIPLKSKPRPILRQLPCLTSGLVVFLFLTIARFSWAALEDSVRAAPAVRALDQRVESARELAGAAGLFPDPRVEAMVERGNNSGGASWPKWEGRLEQPLPKAGERRADKERARAEIAMAEAERALMAGGMAAEVAMAMAEADAANQRAELLKSQLVRMEKVLALIETRLAAGQGKLADRLALQSRIAAMNLMIEEEQRMSSDALLRARGMLGIPPRHPLPGFAAPERERVNPLSTPAMAMAAAKESEAQAMEAMAKATGRPMTALAVSASREEMPMETEDMIGVSFMIEIPFNARKGAVAGQRSAMAKQNAAKADAASARFRTEAAIARAERARRWAESARTLADGTLARLEAEYETVVKSAAVGGMNDQSTVLMLLELLDKRVETGISVIGAETAARTSAAALWEHVFVTPVNMSSSPHLKP